MWANVLLLFFTRFMTTLLLLCLLWPNPSAGQTTGRPVEGEAKTAFLKSWSEHLHNMRTLHMVFTQAKHLRLLRQPLITQGELWLKGQILYYVSKNVAGTTELQLRVDERTVKTYYPLLKTLEVIELHTTQPPPLAMPFLRRDAETMQETYMIDIVATGTRYTLHLTPRNPASPIRDIHLTLQNFQPLQFSQTEKNGNRLEMQISTFTTDFDPDDSQLELHIPTDTTIIYPLK
jgi:outer membrane lipoprotein-sorting protein